MLAGWALSVVIGCLEACLEARGWSAAALFAKHSSWSPSSDASLLGSLVLVVGGLGGGSGTHGLFTRPTAARCKLTGTAD